MCSYIKILTTILWGCWEYLKSRVVKWCAEGHRTSKMMLLQLRSLIPNHMVSTLPQQREFFLQWHHNTPPILEVKHFCFILSVVLAPYKKELLLLCHQGKRNLPTENYDYKTIILKERKVYFPSPFKIPSMHNTRCWLYNSRFLKVCQNSRIHKKCLLNE